MLDFQTLHPSEIIVVDDGSTDNTAAIAERTSARVIRARHRGQAATRNAGIAAASNEWIALLDADDIWDPQKLEWQWQLCGSHPELSLVATDFDAIDPSGSVLREDSVMGLRQYRYLTATPLEKAASLLATDLLARSFPEWGLFLTSSILISRELFIRVGGFNTSVITEDNEFFLRCIARGKTAMIERPLVGYVRHPSQVTATWQKDSAGLNLCEHVMAHPEDYHPETVTVFRDRFPTLLLRSARLEASRGNYRRAVSQVFRAVTSPRSPSAAVSIGLRLAARNRGTRALLSIFPAARDSMRMIPDRNTKRKQRDQLPPWPSLIAAAGDALQ
jgi:glycosyltransferase involved in cell wall biosynthesis